MTRPDYDPELHGSYGNYLFEMVGNPYRMIAVAIRAERPEKDDGEEETRIFMDPEDYGRAMACDNLAQRIDEGYEIPGFPKPDSELFLMATHHEKEPA